MTGMPDDDAIAAAENPFLAQFRGLETAPGPLTAAQWQAAAPAIRRAAFFSATVEDEKLLEGLRKYCDTAIEQGWTTAEFLANTRRWMRETKDALGIPYDRSEDRLDTMTSEQRRRYENSVRHIDSIARLKLIFRTQSEMASGYRLFLQDLAPEELERNPGWLFYRTPGAKTFRADHEAHEGELRLKTDADYWLARNDASFGGFGNPYPPFGYNSWMWVAPRSRKECEQAGLLQPGQPVPEPDPRLLRDWGLPAFVRRSLGTRGVSSISPEGRRRIIERNREENGVVVEPTPDGQGLAITMESLWPDAGRNAATPTPGSPAPATPAQPKAATPQPAPAGDAGVAEETAELLRHALPGYMFRALAKAREPKRGDYATEAAWKKAHDAWRKLWRMDDGVQAANPHGCNGAGHKPGCPLGKGTSREGETRPPARHAPEERPERAETLYADSRCKVLRYADGRTLVHVEKAVEDRKEAKERFQKIIGSCRQGGKSKGIPGKGFMAPGMRAEFYVSRKSLGEMVENSPHIDKSDSSRAHLTAACIADALWEHSYEGIARSPKKGDSKDESLARVHERKALMRLDNETYEVKITAFEYKNKNNDPLLYDINVRKKNAGTPRHS